MDIIKDYFLCDKCRNRNLIQIYNFSVHFRRVNFSDDLIYDEATEALYQCTHCKKIFSQQQIGKALKRIIDERLKSLGLPKK